MKIAIIVFGLFLSGCETSTALRQDSPKTASMPIPCGPDNCGKPVTWEYQ